AGGAVVSCSRIALSASSFFSLSSWKRPQPDWSAGIGWLFVQPPQAYWKKSSHGAADGSIEPASIPGGSGGGGAWAAGVVGVDCAIDATAAGPPALGATVGAGCDAPQATANATKGSDEAIRRRMRDTSGGADGTPLPGLDSHEMRIFLRRNG